MPAPVVEVTIHQIVVESDYRPIYVDYMGIQGPPGSAYQHTQASASATWTVNHNLGFRPNIAALTPGGLEMEVEVVHTSVNQAILYLAAAMSGTALCS